MTGLISRSVLIGTLSLGSLAFANGKDASEMFKSMDANTDGKISSDEHAQSAATMFSSMDANQDGQVTVAEMTAFKESKGKKSDKAELVAAEKIRLIDQDGDGVLTSTEHAQGARLMFERMDTNTDGFLTKEEFVKGHEKMLHKAS